MWLTNTCRLLSKKWSSSKNFAARESRSIYARVTDSKWSPVVNDTNNYPNICEGMFRCANFWGNFNLLTHDKNGSEFKAGLQVLESLRKKP